jgi:hypothetical protein
MGKRLKTTRHGVVQKVIPRFFKEPEKAEIRLEEADELYREVRIENEVESEDGQKAKLKPGAEVEITIKADETETTPHDDEGIAPEARSKA